MRAGEFSMLVDPGNSAAGSTVTGAIRQASQATGTSFSYLLATAQVESGLNPHAGASTSSARGLFQFVEQTWLGTMKHAGTALGYGRYADAITQTKSGHYEVKDPATRAQILKLRNDPAANAAMAGAFTRANATYLTQRLGRPPSEGELYIAHFLGAAGAARLITLAANNPNAKATDFFANAAHANQSIFFDRKTGVARSVAGVRDVLTGRYDVARARPSGPAALQAADNPAPLSIVPDGAVPDAATAAQPANVPGPLSLVPDTAGITNAFAAATPAAPAPPAVTASAAAPQGRQIFHGLFQDSGRSTPVASAISQLWSVPNSSSGAPASPSAPVNLLDLFTDPVEGS
jgi:hypothetical protein